MILKIALSGVAGSVGFGTYFGLIFVFLRSRPTIEVPRGSITPPLTLLNLYKSLSSWERSKFEFRVSPNSVDATVCAPAGETALAPRLSTIPYPGLLSIKCSPGNNRIVVLSIISLSFPRTYEKRADSNIAL